MSRVRQILGSLVGQVRHADDLGAVLRGGGVMLFIQGGAAAASFVVLVMLSRWMGVTEFGIYTFAFAWATILSIPAGLGLPLANVRFIAQYLAAEDYAKLRGLMGRSRIITLAFGAVLASGGVVILALLNQVIGAYYLPLCIAFAAIPIIAWLNLESQIARGFGWVALAFAPRDVGQPLLLIGVVAVMLVLDLAITAVWVAAATVFAYVAMVLVQRRVSGRRAARTIPPVAPRFETGYWLSVAFPLMLTNGFQIVMTQADLVMVGLIRTPDEVAVYQAAARTSGLVLFVLTATNAQSGPRISALHSQNRLDELQRLLSRLIHWIFWPSLLAAAVVIGFGELLLSLFGADFVAGYPALIILGVGMTVNAAAGPVVPVLIMAGHQRLCARILGVSVLVNIALNAMLIAPLGVLGAALATAASRILWNLWLLVMSARKLGLYPSLIRLPDLRRR